MKRRRALAALLLAAAALATGTAPAQAWPDKPIRFVMTAPAGSSIDVLGRTIADKLKDRLGFDHDDEIRGEQRDPGIGDVDDRRGVAGEPERAELLHETLVEDVETGGRARPSHGGPEHEPVERSDRDIAPRRLVGAHDGPDRPSGGLGVAGDLHRGTPELAAQPIPAGSAGGDLLDRQRGCVSPALQLGDECVGDGRLAGAGHPAELDDHVASTVGLARRSATAA